MHLMLCIIISFISYSFIKAIEVNDYKLTIIHANDLLSAFSGVKNNNNLCDLNSDQKECVGGADRIVSKIREFRAKEHILFVSVGGHLGGYWFNHFGSDVVINFMRELQFDVITLGLSDYAFNDVFMTDSKDYYKDIYENITRFISDVSLVSRIVSCNVEVDTKYISNFYSNVRKSTIIIRGNRRIGIIGFVKKSNDVNVYSKKRDSASDLVRIGDPIKCIEEEAENLRKEGIDIIIAIGSGDSDYFKEIASNVSNIDLVIGGFASSKNLSQLNERTSNTYPDFVVKGNSGNVIVSTADVFGKSIGKISVTFDRFGVIQSNEGLLIKVNNSIESDEKTKILIDRYERKLLIGTTNVFLNGSLCSVHECNLGNVIADSLVFYRVNYLNDSFVKTFIEENGNEVLKRQIHEVRDVIGLVNDGIISASIGNINKTEYFVTNVNLDQVFLKANSMDMSLKMHVLNGKAIKNILEESVLEYGQSYPSHQFLQVSGIKVTYDMSKASYEKVTDVLIKCTLCSGENYTKLNETKFYDVLLPQSIKISADINSLELSPDLKVFDVVQHYFKENSPLNTLLEQRITIIEITDTNWTTVRLSSQLMVLFFAFISLLLIY